MCQVLPEQVKSICWLQMLSLSFITYIRIRCSRRWLLLETFLAISLIDRLPKEIPVTANPILRDVICRIIQANQSCPNMTMPDLYNVHHAKVK